jgi:Ser/Thr protein kinase RdoA (MazF antagonist)
MEKRIRERYSEAILKEAMARYGIASGRINLLDGFESYMYEFERDNAAYILRIGHSIRRSEAQIHGEVDWINHLARNGTSVARAVLSTNGHLVETIDDGQGGSFLATAFVRARGRPPVKTDWTPSMFETYGRLIGRMHALSKSYEPADPAWRRPHMDDPIMLDTEQWLRPEDSGVIHRYNEIRDHLNGLARDDRDAYGLIHQDAHGGNFFIAQDGTITLFDFDDCVYGWFIYDIAMVVFYAAMGQEDAGGFTVWFLNHFFKGYDKENSLDPVWMAELPMFLRLREIDLYAVIHRSFDVDNLDDPWCARFMRDRKRRIETAVPFIDLDLESLRGLL